MSVLANSHNVNINHLNNNNVFGNLYNNHIVGANAGFESRLDPISDASFARDKTRSPPDSECLLGTREGVIEKVTVWADEGIFSSSSHVYWLYGYAGCGKSSLLQAVAERFHNKGRLAASFFFFQSSERRSRFKSVPATLASQMAEAIPATAPLILAALQADFGLLSKPVGTQMELLVYNPLKVATKWYRLGACIKVFFEGPFLIAIDGLDECEDKKDVEQFIDHMLFYFSQNPYLPLRFFIASRVEEHIRTRLNTDKVLLDNLADHSPDEDIIAFIHARLALAAKHDLVVQAYGPSWPDSRDIRGLAKLSKGSFIFISMLLKYIFETVDDGLTPMQRLPRALEMKSNLDGLYASTLNRSKDLPHFPSIISTLAYLREPLPTSSIAELLNIELYEVIAVLVNLQAIIQLPGDENTPVTLCHSSLQDFLTTESRSGPFFPFLHRVNHEDMAYRCLDLLIRHRPTESIIRSLDNLAGLRYAYNNVNDHLVLASEALNYDQHYYNRVGTYMNQQFPTSFPLVLSTHLMMQGSGGWTNSSEPLVGFPMLKFPQPDLEFIAKVLITLSNHPNARKVLALLHSDPRTWIQENDDCLYGILVSQCRVAGSSMFPEGICTILFPGLTLFLLYLAHSQLSYGCTIFSDILSKQEEWSSLRVSSVERLASFDAVREYLCHQFSMLVSERENEQHLKERAEHLIERDTCHLAAWLLELTDDEKEWTRFLEMEDKLPSVGHNIVNLFQALLAFPPLRPVHGKLLKALLNLSRKAGLYPQSLFHRGMDELSTYPVACGGFADVHKGMVQNQVVAVKIMRNLSGRPRPGLMKKMRQEAIIWNQLHHPNILPFYGIMLKPDGEGSPRTCLISPWMENGNVLGYIKAKSDVNREDLIRDVANGLDYLHSFRPAIVHGDIKGDNVLVSPSGRACLADFGLGRLLQDQDKEWLQPTTYSVQPYLAPELLEGQEVDGHSIRKSPSTDIYAFGHLCYEIYTGHPRHPRILSPLGRIMSILRGRPCEKPPMMRDDLWAKVEECWNRVPETRPPIADFHAIFSGRFKNSNVTETLNPLEEWEWDSGIRLRMRPEETFTISLEDSSGSIFQAWASGNLSAASRAKPRSRQTT